MWCLSTSWCSSTGSAWNSCKTNFKHAQGYWFRMSRKKLPQEKMRKDLRCVCLWKIFSRRCYLCQVKSCSLDDSILKLCAFHDLLVSFVKCHMLYVQVLTEWCIWTFVFISTCHQFLEYGKESCPISNLNFNTIRSISSERVCIPYLFCCVH